MHSPASGTRWCSSSSLHPLNWPLCAAHSLKGHVWQPCPGLPPDPVLFEACHATSRQGGTAPPTGISPIQWISGRVRIRGSEKEQSWGHQIQALHFTDEETDRWLRTHLESGRETVGSPVSPPSSHVTPEGAWSPTACCQFLGVLSQTARTSRRLPGPAS